MPVPEEQPHDESTNLPGRRVRFAELTARGRGAISVLGVWGPDAVGAVDLEFRPARGSGLAASPAGRPRLGRIGAGSGDEVVVIVQPSEPPEVEIHCHGGLAAVQLVAAALEHAGATRAEIAEWEGRNGCARTTLEARLDLPHAPTRAAAAILLDQSDGALERQVGVIRARILAGDTTGASAGLNSLLASAAVGLRLTRGWSLVLCGRPNVGKSRLLNALAGFDRAIVAPEPGTTRDIVRVATAIGGWPVELSDTAGLREAVDSVEREGVRRAVELQEGADLLLLVLDRSQPLGNGDRTLLIRHPRALRVATKSDLPPAWDEQTIEAVAVSAMTGTGVDRLVSRIAATLVPVPPEPGAAVPFRLEQVRLLEQASAELREDRAASAVAILGRLLEP